MLSEDTLHRRLISSNVLYTRRFLTKTNKIPTWGEWFVPASLKRVVPLIEESYVDREAETVVTYTRNVGLSRFMTAVEKVVYRKHPDDPETKTIAEKEAWIESGLVGIRSAVKNFGIERFKSNCQKATEGFNFILRERLEKSRLRMESVREKAKAAKDYAKSHSNLHAAEEEK